MERPGRVGWPFLALLGGALGIGLAPIWVRLSQVGPSATGFYRLLLALPFLWAWMGLKSSGPSQPPRVPRGPELRALALAGFFFAADLGLWHWSIQWTSVANSTLLANCAPLFVTTGAWFLYREKVSLGFMLGMFVALAGCALLAAASFELNPQHLLGDIVALITAIFYAGYMLTLKKLRAASSTPRVLAWAGIVSCLLLGLAALLSGERMVPVSASGWLTLLGLAVTSHVAGQGLIAYAMGHLSASFLSVTLLLQPLVAAVLGWWLLGEKIGPRQMAGGFVVLAGVAVATREQPPVLTPVKKV